MRHPDHLGIWSQTISPASTAAYFLSVNSTIQLHKLCTNLKGLMLFFFYDFSMSLLNVWDLSRRYPAIYYEKWRQLLKRIQDTRNIVQRTMTPQSPSKQAPWGLTQFSQSPSYFPEFQQSEISSLLKVILVLGKARSFRAPNLGYRGLSHLDELMFHKKILHETWYMSGHIVMRKLPITSCS